ADTGAPPPIDVSNAAHAGCLSFEMSSGRQHFVVNCGVDTYGASEFRPLARATAAHSTATLNDTSSARFNHSIRVNDLASPPLIGGPRNVPCRRTDQPGMHGFIASHDGYVAQFGLYHERELSLSEEGSVLAGLDRFLRAGGAPARNNGRDFVAVRFHMHPDVELFHDEEDRLVLTAPHSDRWVMSCAEVTPYVEESIYFAGLGGPRRSRQIVLSFKASEIQEVHWQFTRTYRESIAGKQ
ncbi:MAG: heparinase II/III family protein, partial [Alphaproteobacteria bacterium]|nr:heparinase II/III family protein [Alphaproteobacteria bacterium]